VKRRKLFMKKTLVVMIVGMTITIFACSVWAQNLPLVTMEGSVAKFPKKDNIPDVNLPRIGTGFDKVPTEFKFMLRKWWRGEGIDAVNYLFITKYLGSNLILLITNGIGNNGKPWFISCSPEDGKRMKCNIPDARPGSAFASAFYKLFVKDGVPVIEFHNTPIELREAGDIPKEIY
jgi:hypothetical protein